MVVETWIAHAPEMIVIRLKLDGIARKGLFMVFQGHGLLEEVDESLFPCQACLAVEEKIAEPSIPCFSQASRGADGGERPMDIIWLKLLARHPSQHLCRAMAAIFPLLMGEVFLVVVVLHPLGVRCD